MNEPIFLFADIFAILFSEDAMQHKCVYLCVA